MPETILPPEVTAFLLENVDSIARRMTQRLADDIPLPGEFRRVAYLRAVMAACRDGLRIFVQLLQEQRQLGKTDLARLGAAGARQADLEVPLEVLLAAYRLAAKVVWEEVVAKAVVNAELNPTTVVTVTGQVLEYLDSISGAVGRAYLERRESLLRQSDRERDRLLQRLLAGDTSIELQRTAASYGLELSPPYWVVACQANPANDGSAIEMAWPKPKTLIVPYSPESWLVLLSCDIDLENACNKAITNAQKRQQPVELTLGIGPQINSLSEIPMAVDRARHALINGQKLFAGQRIYQHQEVGIYTAMSADLPALDNFIKIMLDPLLKNSTARNHELLQTLEVMLNSKGLTEAGKTLNLHRHTVVYRVEQLQRLLGLDLENPLQKHQLWLALQALKLRDSN